MLPNTISSSANRYNRHRSRNASGNKSTNSHMFYREPKIGDQHFHGRQLYYGSRNDGEAFPQLRDTCHQLPPRPRSADPSPQRTASRIESLREMHGGPLIMNEPLVSDGGFPPAHHQLIGGSTSILPLIEAFSHSNQPNTNLHLPHTSFPVQPRDLSQPTYGRPIQVQHPPHSSSQPHHHHQLLYLCHGQCTGPRCDFSGPTKRQVQSLVYLDPAQQALHPDQPVHFRSEVVETAPSAFRKLDKKRATLSQMKELLATKLENKHRMRMSRRQRDSQRDKSRERAHKRKSLSSDTIEKDYNAVESYYMRCSSRSQGSDINEDLSLRGSRPRQQKLCF